MASSQVCSDAVLHDISKQDVQRGNAYPWRPVRRAKYAPGGLRSKQGIVWNALERGHSLTEGELGKGGNTGPRQRDERMEWANKDDGKAYQI